MKNTILTALLMILFSAGLSAQFGVSGYINLHQGADDWDNSIPVSNDHVKADGYGLSINYWFRLKDYRVEFLPEIAYFSGSHEGVLPDDTGTDLSWQQIAVFANTNFYLFDLEGDCNCPTFGKDGGFFEKGFFVQLSLGASYWSYNSTIGDLDHEGEQIHFLLGFGGGLDVGISEYITLTPFVRYVLGFGVPWSVTDINVGETEYSSNTRDLLLGLNLIYRLDYKKRRF